MVVAYGEIETGYCRTDSGVGTRSVTTIVEVSSTASILGAMTFFQ